MEGLTGMSDVHYLTSEGLAKLKAELEYLQGPAREELAKRLRFAIQQGDLSENADYIAAKEEQGFLEGRIQELTRILSNYALIDEIDRKDGVVNIGSTVTIQEEGFPPETFYLVGPREANPLENRISHESPIGKAMLGKRVGDTFEAETPNGRFVFTILKIE
ncbi:transcription elongation factor GreA [Anaerolinea thermolimosa]|nr:transcription elongation factor GreA [Anaerolinea thermolimosa]